MNVGTHAREGLARLEPGSTVRMLRRALATVAFWSAIALPSLYLAVLLNGVGSPGELRAVVVLLGCHAVSLVVGHRHKRGDR